MTPAPPQPSSPRPPLQRSRPGPSLTVDSSRPVLRPRRTPYPRTVRKPDPPTEFCRIAVSGAVVAAFRLGVWGVSGPGLWSVAMPRTRVVWGLWVGLWGLVGGRSQSNHDFLDAVSKSWISGVRSRLPSVHAFWD